MKIGDLVKILDASRSPADCRLSGVILDDKPYPPAGNLDVKIQVMWQNGVIGLIPASRLEVINENR